MLHKVYAWMVHTLHAFPSLPMKLVFMYSSQVVVIIMFRAGTSITRASLLNVQVNKHWYSSTRLEKRVDFLHLKDLCLHRTIYSHHAQLVENY